MIRDYHQVILETATDDELGIYVGDYAAENILGGPKIVFGTTHIVFQGDGEHLALAWDRALNALLRAAATMREHLDKLLEDDL